MRSRIKTRLWYNNFCTYPLLLIAEFRFSYPGNASIFYDYLFDEPHGLWHKEKYTLEVEYESSISLMYGRGGRRVQTVNNLQCKDTIEFTFSGGTGGTSIGEGQIPRILFSCD